MYTRPTRFSLLLASLCLAIACGGDEQSADSGPGIDSGPGADSGTVDSGASVDSSVSADAGSDGGEAEPLLMCNEPCPGGFCRGGFTCVEGVCLVNEDALPSCGEDLDCLPRSSFWEDGDTCTSGGGECSPSEECIRLEDGGHCVRTPACRSFAPEEISWPDIDGNPVTVCGNSRLVCDGGMCRLGCQMDDHCSRDYLPHCDQAAKRCVCQTETSDTCALNSLGGTFCGAEGSCGCRNDDDCPNAGFDHCYEGVCGCSDTAACMEFVSGVEIVCAPVPTR